MQDKKLQWQKRIFKFLITTVVHRRARQTSSHNFAVQTRTNVHIDGQMNAASLPQ